MRLMKVLGRRVIVQSDSGAKCCTDLQLCNTSTGCKLIKWGACVP